MWGTGAIERTGGPRLRGVIGSARILGQRQAVALDRAKEAALKANLSVLRRALDEYYSDTGKYPEDLSALTERHYLRALPLDPVTNRTDSWVPVPSADEIDKTIVDVKSGAQGKALDGTEYKSW